MDEANFHPTTVNSKHWSKCTLYTYTYFMRIGYSESSYYESVYSCVPRMQACTSWLAFINYEKILHFVFAALYVCLICKPHFPREVLAGLPIELSGLRNPVKVTAIIGAPPVCSSQCTFSSCEFVRPAYLLR